MTKSEKEKLSLVHDELLDMWQSSDNEKNANSVVKAEAYREAIMKIKSAFPSLFVNPN